MTKCLKVCSIEFFDRHSMVLSFETTNNQHRKLCVGKKVSVLKKRHKNEKIQKSVCHGSMKIDKNLLSLLSLQNEFGYFF